MPSSPPSPQLPPRLPQGEIKKGRASLVGGVAVGVAVLALWVLLTRDLGAHGLPVVVTGVFVAAGVATWIRLADL